MRKNLQMPFLSLLALGVLSACQNETTVETIVQKKVEIAPPIPALDIPYLEFEVKPNEDNTFVLENGTTIEVPAHALLDAEGKPITEPATLAYREFHDAVDVLLSGIPMDYEANGRTRTMQTAGMFDINATLNGQSLSIAEDKGVKVQMASYETDTDYNFFKLDTTEGWEFIDYVAPVANANKKKTTTKSAGLEFPLSKRYFAFSMDGILDVMYSDNWQEINKNRDNPSVKRKVEAYGLSYLNVNGHQYVTFEGNQHPSSFLVWKRVSGRSFPKWLKDGEYWDYSLTKKRGNTYAFEAVNKDKSQTYKADVEIVMPLKALLKFSPDYWETNYEEGIAKMKEEEARLKAQADVFRTFELNNFGIYNYDRLLKDDTNILVKADFQVKDVPTDNELYEMDMVFFLPEDNKTLIKFPKGDWEKVRLIPDNKARFLTILPNGAIGVYGVEEYTNIDFEALRKEEQPSYAFELVKEFDNLESSDELREILNM